MRHWSVRFSTHISKMSLFWMLMFCARRLMIEFNRYLPMVVFPFVVYLFDLIDFINNKKCLKLKKTFWTNVRVVNFSSCFCVFMVFQFLCLERPAYNILQYFQISPFVLHFYCFNFFCMVFCYFWVLYF